MNAREAKRQAYSMAAQSLRTELIAGPLLEVEDVETEADFERVSAGMEEILTSSPRLKPGDSNRFMLRVQQWWVGAVVPRGFLRVPASVTALGPRASVGLGRR